jgi:hypothetical protein
MTEKQRVDRGVVSMVGVLVMIVVVMMERYSGTHGMMMWMPETTGG